MRDQIGADARLDRDYLALLIVATIVASLGLEQNSAATIIGAMVVAPLMLPIRSLGFGLLHFDGAAIWRSARMLAVSIVIILILSATIGWISGRPEFGSEILSRTTVTFLALGVALAGGALAGLSRALGASKITDSLVGVGISVSLVPPLCVAGIALAYGAWFESEGAFMIFLTNLVGIALACAIVFALTGFAPAQGWRMALGFVTFAIAVAALSPVLATTAYRARELSDVEYFLARHAKEYLPSVLAVESTTISWKAEPFEMLILVRAPRVPTGLEARRLNAAINSLRHVNYHATLVVDPAVTVVPSSR